MREISSQLLEHLKACISRDDIIIVLNVSVDVFLELGDFQVMVALIVGIHFDPVVPVELSDAHGDVGFPMSEGTIDLRLGGIEVEVLKSRR